MGASVNQKPTAIVYLPFLIWPTALLPKTAQFGILLVLATYLLLKYGGKFLSSHKFRTSEVYLFIFCTIYAVSIIINAPDADTTRIYASVNTFSMWLVSFIVFVTYRTIDLDSTKVSKLAFISVCILVIMSIAYYSGLRIDVPVINRHLVGNDWINGASSKRMSGFFEYSTLNAASYLIFFPASLPYVAKWDKKVFSYAYCIVAVLPTIACGSRTGILLAFVSAVIGIYYIYTANSSSELSRKTFTMLLLLVAASFVAIFHTDIVEFIEKLIGMRAGSTNTRIALYEYTYNAVIEKSPIIGCGIKETNATFGSKIPVGSHSTYLGVFYRTGIIGSLIFVALLISLLKDVASNYQSKAMRLCVFSSLALCFAFFITEDADGANWLIVSIFSLLGFITHPKDPAIVDVAAREHPAKAEKTCRPTKANRTRKTAYGSVKYEI